MEKKLKVGMFGHKRVPSREGGIEIVVEELAKRMVREGYQVTCYNRAGHHVSGAEYDAETKSEYEGIRLKTVPTLRGKDWRQFHLHSLQRCAVLLENMMWYISMRRDRRCFAGFRSYLGRK